MKVEMEGVLRCFMLPSLCEILEVVSAEAKGAFRLLLLEFCSTVRAESGQSRIVHTEQGSGLMFACMF